MAVFARGCETGNHLSRLGANAEANIGTSLPKIIQTCLGFVGAMRVADGTGMIARLVAGSIQNKNVMV